MWAGAGERDASGGGEFDGGGSGSRNGNASKIASNTRKAMRPIAAPTAATIHGSLRLKASPLVSNGSTSAWRLPDAGSASTRDLGLADGGESARELGFADGGELA